MKVTGSATVAAPRERVYAALRDPAVLARTIPGCQGLETVGPDAYRLTVSAGVAAIRGTYSGSVVLSDPEPPASFVLRAQGRGAPGTVDATVRVLLSEDGGTGTRVEYDADATVGGMVGGVGQRLLAGAARKTAAEFFDAVARDLTGPPADVPARQDAAEPTQDTPPPPLPSTHVPGWPSVRQREVPPPQGAGHPDNPFFQERKGSNQGEFVICGKPGPVAVGVLSGAVAGAVAALAGVALGAAIARRR